MSGTSGRSDRFVEALRAGEPRAAQAGDRLLRTMRRIAQRGLTDGQVDVLRLFSEGLSAREVGRLLHLSPEGVRSREKAARAVLGARTRAHAVALWLRQPG